MTGYWFLAIGLVGLGVGLIIFGLFSVTLYGMIIIEPIKLKIRIVFDIFIGWFKGSTWLMNEQAKRLYESVFDQILLANDYFRRINSKSNHWQNTHKKVYGELAILFITQSGVDLYIVAEHLHKRRLKNVSVDDINIFLLEECQLIAHNPILIMGHPQRLVEKFQVKRFSAWRVKKHLP